MSARIAAVCLALSAVPALHAQDAELAQDTRFVRALARELRFVSLAQSEVDKMQQRYKDSEAATKSVQQLGIEIALIGAKLNPDREAKRAMFKDALEKVSALVERYDGDPIALAARVTMADATIEFGRFLAEEVEIAREEAPDKVAALEEEAQSVFRAGIDACDKARAEFEKTKDSNPQDRIEYHVSWLRKGILLREQARAVKKDRSYLCDRSRDELEELIFEVGEETLLGQKALFEHAQNDEVLGKAESAAQSYTDVIESVHGALTSEDLDLPSDVRELMVVLMEEAYDRRGSVQFQLGRTDDVIATVQEYRERLKALDVPITEFKEGGEIVKGNEDERFGHSLYITEARAMAESGQPELVAKALSQATYFNDQHPNDLVGLKAKEVIKDILEAQTKLVSGELLLTVAKGDYQAKDYEQAIRGLKKAIGAMSDAELAKHGLDAYWHMGRAFAVEGRALEATLALVTGLEKHATTTADANLPGTVSSFVQRTMGQAKADAKNAAHLAGLSDRVDAQISVHGQVSDLAQRLYNDGLKLMRDKKFAEAIATFEKVVKDSAWYELAATNVISAHQRNDDLASARKALEEYRTFIASKDGQIADDNRTRIQTRATGEARAAFYEGYLDYLAADQDGKKDLTKYPLVIQKLGDFAQTYGKQAPELVERANYVVGRALIEIGELTKAEERYRTLVRESPGKPTVAVLASSILSAYYDRIQAKETELAALDKGDDEAAANKAREELANLRRQGLAIGVDYLKTADKPVYGNAYVALQLAQDLGDWDQVESLGNDIIKTFSGTRDKKKVDKYIKEIVGTAVLRQHKYRQAYDLLVDVEKANPSKLAIKRLIALAQGGWMEINERGGIERYPGIGEPDKAYDKYWTEYKKYGLHPDKAPRYSLDWYRFHLEVLYFARSAEATDSQFKARAQSLYNIAEANDDFKTLRGLGKEGRDMADMFSQLK